MTQVTFNGDVKAALSAAKAGDEVLCPKCGAVLWIKDGTGLGRALPIHPGIQCPNDERHVQVLWSLTAVRDRMRAVLGTREEKDEPRIPRKNDKP